MNLVAIPGATTYHTPALGSGDYKVQVTDTNGCQSFSDVYVYTGSATTGINNITTEAITIFPNPATNELTITITDPVILSGVEGSSFTITNSIGQQMLQQPLSLIKTNVNVGTFPAGIYYINFKGENGTNVQKFVKM
jgi:hypothetical protein